MLLKFDYQQVNFVKEAFISPGTYPTSLFRFITMSSQTTSVTDPSVDKTDFYVCPSLELTNNLIKRRSHDSALRNAAGFNDQEFKLLKVSTAISSIRIH